MRGSCIAAVLGIGLCMCALVFIPEACSTVPDKGKNPEDIVMNSCTVCHDLERVCANLGKKDQGQWNSTVTAMAGKGARVDQQDIPMVAGYLAGLKSGARPVCK